MLNLFRKYIKNVVFNLKEVLSIHFNYFFLFYKYNIYGYILFLVSFLLIDILLLDDEPFLEPIEWSWIQSFLLYTCLFAWLVETIVSSNYGSFTGRDKRVYIGLFKCYWFIELLFMFTVFITAVFIWTPFYFEITYKVSHIVSWWSWYNRIFFFKYITIFFILDIIISILFINLKWFNYKKIFMLMSLILICLFYIFYFQFLIIFFGYFSDILSFKNNNLTGFNKLQEGPYRTHWGDSNRDFFNYKRSSLNIWYKNDSQYALSVFFINIFNFLSISFLIIQLILILSKIFWTKKISYSLLTYFNSSLNNFFLFYIFFFSFLVIIFIYQLMRYTNDFSWIPVFMNFFYFFF